MCSNHIVAQTHIKIKCLTKNFKVMKIFEVLHKDFKVFSALEGLTTIVLGVIISRVKGKGVFEYLNSKTLFLHF